MNQLKAIIYKVGYSFALAWWWLRRPVTTGVRCIIVADGKILLVRHTYGHSQWTVPGGGVKTSEAVEAAVRREVQEEAGVSLGAVTKVGEVYFEGEYRKDTIHVFFARLEAIPVVVRDTAEIAEMKWFSLQSLPENTLPLCLEYLALARL